MIKTELKNQCFNLTGKKCLRTGQCGDCKVTGIVAGLKAGLEARGRSQGSKSSGQSSQNSKGGSQCGPSESQEDNNPHLD